MATSADRGNLQANQGPVTISLGVKASLPIAGICIGWLAGLSVSPVATVLITSVIGAIVSATAALSGVQGKIGNRADNTLRDFAPSSAVPLTLLVLGLACGVTVGIAARAQAWLSPTPEAVASRWSGIDRSLITQRLFDQVYPPLVASVGQSVNPPQSLPSAEKSVNLPPVISSPAPARPNLAQTVLFSAKDDECRRFLTKTGADLKAELQSSVSSPAAKRFANQVSDPAALAAAVRIFICPK